MGIAMASKAPSVVGIFLAQIPLADGSFAGATLDFVDNSLEFFFRDNALRFVGVAISGRRRLPFLCARER